MSPNIKPVRQTSLINPSPIPVIPSLSLIMNLGLKQTDGFLMLRLCEEIHSPQPTRPYLVSHVFYTAVYQQHRLSRLIY